MSKGVEEPTADNLRVEVKMTLGAWVGNAKAPKISRQGIILPHQGRCNAPGSSLTSSHRFNDCAVHVQT